MNPGVKYLIGVYILMLLVIFILPFFSADNYSIVSNTTSQLGAQETSNAWIMNLTFVLLGTGSIVAGWKVLKAYWLHRILLLAFGISLILTAVFSHAPIDPDIPYDMDEDKLHSLFASTTGFSFTLFAISSAFIMEKQRDRWIAIAIGVLGTVLSILMFQLDGYKGIWQRLIFISAFGWMIYVFSRPGKVRAADR